MRTNSHLITIQLMAKKAADIKTKPTAQSIDAFIDAMADEQKRNDSRIILAMRKKATKEKPKLWGTAIIGFGDMRYKSPATGREVVWFRIGFAPRKANLSLYLLDLTRHAETLPRLGKHKTGVGCLYIKKLAYPANPEVVIAVYTPAGGVQFWDQSGLQTGVTEDIIFKPAGRPMASSWKLNPSIPNRI